MALTLENRTFSVVQKVSLIKPKPTWTPTVEPDVCPCEPFNVFGLQGGETWQQDITGAWIKMFSSSDICSFVLYNEEGLETIYSCPILSFVNDQYSKYTQVDWTDVLLSDGIGCYTLKIEYTIAGVTDVYEWGEYKLFEFNIPMVEKTVRTKVVLNSNQLIEGINFSGSKVIDTFRFDVNLLCNVGNWLTHSLHSITVSLKLLVMVPVFPVIGCKGLFIFPSSETTVEMFQRGASSKPSIVISPHAETAVYPVYVCLAFTVIISPSKTDYT